MLTRFRKFHVTWFSIYHVRLIIYPPFPFAVTRRLCDVVRVAPSGPESGPWYFNDRNPPDELLELAAHAHSEMTKVIFRCRPAVR